MKAISKGSGSKKFFLPATPVNSPVLEDLQPNSKSIIEAERITFFIVL
jgi:hypothetical protein